MRNNGFRSICEALKQESTDLDNVVPKMGIKILTNNDGKSVVSQTYQLVQNLCTNTYNSSLLAQASDNLSTARWEHCMRIAKGCRQQEEDLFDHVPCFAGS